MAVDTSSKSSSNSTITSSDYESTVLDFVHGSRGALEAGRTLMLNSLAILRNSNQQHSDLFRKIEPIYSSLDSAWSKLQEIEKSHA